MNRGRVWLAPRMDPAAIEAVTIAGGRVVSTPTEADTFLIGDDEPRTVGAALHAGVEWIHFESSGVEPWLSAGIIDERRLWTSSKGAYSLPIAEHALSLMMACAKQLAHHARARSWGEQRGTALHGAKVVILGGGGIGQHLVRLSYGLEMNVDVVTRSGMFARPDLANVYRPKDWPELLANADFVVLAAPLTAETKHVVSEAALTEMKSTACLVNVARGELVDTDALALALEAGEIGSAGLDVVEPEPLPSGHPLWRCETAIITPHTACPRWVALPYVMDRIAENVKRFRARQPLLGVVSPTAGY